MSAGPRLALSEERGAAASLSDLVRASASAEEDAVFARIGPKASDATAALRAGAVDALADHYRARFRDAGAVEGRILMLGAAEPRALAAIVGAMRAGLSVVLAPTALDAASIAAVARRCQARALAGPTAFANLPLAQRLFEAAAMVDEIALVSLYGRSVAGALALDAPVEDDETLEAPNPNC